MCHFLLEWANSATNSSFILYHPFTTALPCLMEKKRKEKKGMERKGKEKKREAPLHPQRSESSHLEPFLRLLWWWTILTIRVQKSLVLRKALSCRVMDTQVQKEHQRASPLEKMTGLFSLLSILLQSLSDGEPAFAHSDGTLPGPPHSSQHSLGLWWSPFSITLLIGPPKNNLKAWTLASEASEFS